jgi:hypothetical protein
MGKKTIIVNQGKLLMMKIKETLNGKLNEREGEEEIEEEMIFFYILIDPYCA